MLNRLKMWILSNLLGSFPTTFLEENDTLGAFKVLDGKVNAFFVLSLRLKVKFKSYHCRFSSDIEFTAFKLGSFVFFCIFTAQKLHFENLLKINDQTKIRLHGNSCQRNVRFNRWTFVMIKLLHLTLNWCTCWIIIRC